jgi:hypothetical protein
MTARTRTLSSLLFCVIGLVARPSRAEIRVVVVGSKVGGSTAGGDPAPDNDGVFFGAGVPVINASGQVAFFASFTTGSGGTGVVRAGTTPGSVELLARQGDPAPDGNGNFGLFDDRDAPQLNDAGQVAFPIQFTGTFGPNDGTAVVRSELAPPLLTVVLRQGQTVGAVPVGVLDNPPPSMNGSGSIVVGSLQSNATFVRAGGTTTVLAHGGDAAPGGGVWVVPTSPQPVINDAGQIAFATSVSGTPNGFVIEFVRADGGTIAQVIQHGDPAPDQNGTFDLLQTASVLHAPGLNEDGELAFVAALAVPSGPATQGIFRASDPDHVVQIVRRGQASPDGNGSILGFDLDGDDVVPVNDAGQAAFQATLTATAQGTADNLAMFRGDGTTLVRVARTGQPSPDGDGVFSDFDHPALNAAGQVAFQATLSGTSHTQGIYLWDDVAGLVPVARLGDPLLGQTIAGLRFTHDTSRGRSHVGLNQSGKVAFQFDLNDGRRGIAVWSIGAGTTTSTTSIGPTTTMTSTTTASTTLTPTTGVTPTSIPGRGGSTTLAGATTTTTTLPPCDTVRCIVGDARGGECADETLPSSVTTKLDRAATQADQAPLQSAKKARRLYTSAKRLLGKAGKAATKASRGKHPKISTGCAAGVAGAVQRATAVLNGGGLSR